MFWALFVAAPPLDGPVEIEAKGGLELDLKAARGEAKDGVVLRHRDLVVCCERATAFFVDAAIAKVDCRGAVRVVRADGMSAVADTLAYDVKSATLRLEGHAKVHTPIRDATAELNADAIVVDLASDKISAQGKPSRATLAKGPPAPVECPPR